MKKIIYFLFAIVLFSAYSTDQPVRDSSASPEIEVTK
jgi:hypothetical protein